MLPVRRNLKTISRMIFRADSYYCQSGIIQQWWKSKLFLLKCCASSKQCGGKVRTAAFWYPMEENCQLKGLAILTPREQHHVPIGFLPGWDQNRSARCTVETIRSPDSNLTTSTKPVARPLNYALQMYHKTTMLNDGKRQHLYYQSDIQRIQQHSVHVSAATQAKQYCCRLPIPLTFSLRFYISSLIPENFFAVYE
jgi:hypothetical protein